MARTRAVYFNTPQQAFAYIAQRIVQCLQAGGIPRMWLPGIREDGYVGVDVVCVDATDKVPTVRVLAPPDEWWMNILERMNETKGDWKWILKMAGIPIEAVTRAITYA